MEFTSETINVLTDKAILLLIDLILSSSNENDFGSLSEIILYSSSFDIEFSKHCSWFDSDKILLTWLEVEMSKSSLINEISVLIVEVFFVDNDGVCFGYLLFQYIKWLRLRSSLSPSK